MPSQQDTHESSRERARSHGTGCPPAIDTHGRLWLILLAVAFFGGFLVLAAATPLESAVRSPMPRTMARAWGSVMPFIQPFASAGSSDSLLVDCLSLALFGTVLLGASGIVRRAGARQRAMRNLTTPAVPVTRSAVPAEHTRAVA